MGRETLHRGALDRIGKWIAIGRYPAGSLLPTEPRLCAMLDVSRTTLREAVKSLAAKGMLRTRPRTGTVVCAERDWNLFDPQVVSWRLRRPVTKQFARDLIDLRMTIEPAACAFAAERADDADLAAMEDAFARMVRAVDGHGDYTEADLAFHRAILGATHNGLFEQLAPAIGSVLNMSFDLSTHSMESARASLPAHRAVLESVRRRQAARARAAMEGLIRSAADDIAQVLNSTRRRRGAA